MPTMELNGKTVELENKPADYNSVTFVPKPDEPSIKKPAPVIKPSDSSSTTRATRTRTKPDKADKARVKPEPVQLDPKDYTDALDGALTGLWVATASIPYTTAYAVVLDANKAGLVASLNQAANANSTARTYVEKFTSGSGGMWGLSLAVVGANMAMQTYQLATDPELRKQMSEHQRGKLTDWAKSQGFNTPLEKEPADEPKIV